MALAAPAVPAVPATAPAPLPARARSAGPSLAALVTLTVPWATFLGQSETPGSADGFGLLDGDDARDLAAAAPPPGHPVVHHRAEPRRHRRRPRLPDRPPPPARHRHPPGPLAVTTDPRHPRSL